MITANGCFPLKFGNMAKRKKNYNILKKKILRTIKANKLDFKDTDVHLVDRFIEVQEIADISIEDIRERGVVTPINTEGTVLQKNHSVSAYTEALKIQLEISKKLGLSARDRADLGMIPEEKDNF